MIKSELLYLVLLLLAGTLSVSGQYAPAAGIAGTDAVHCDSSAINIWASKCRVIRGLQQAGNPGLGVASSGNDIDCLGKADNIAVSLGDGGVSVVKFTEAVKDISGNDFAVFENSFDGRFLELAFVDVSSDSIRWVRFPSVSLTQTAVQISTFDLLSTDKIENLAGKYQALYGTPFNLADIKDSSGIDLNNVRYIRITDVVGCVSDPFASFDSRHNRINDPWPTPFPQSGFDLDAIAILRSVKSSINVPGETRFKIFPNPATSRVWIRFTGSSSRDVDVYNSSGFIILNKKSDETECEIDVSSLAKGLYFIRITDGNTKTIRKLIIG